MPKKDRSSKIHDQETIDLMVLKENTDRPGLNLTKEDMSEALIEDREDALDKKRKQAALKTKLKKDYGP